MLRQMQDHTTECLQARNCKGIMASQVAGASVHLAVQGLADIWPPYAPTGDAQMAGVKRWGALRCPGRGRLAEHPRPCTRLAEGKRAVLVQAGTCREWALGVQRRLHA